jgi:hypothetical protein
MAESMAIEFLWMWTGQRFGLCPVTVRPCATVERPSTFWGRGPYPRPGYGVWTNLGGCDSCGDRCRCGTPSRVRLDYWVDGSYLIRLDGEAWPRTQDLDLPPTEPDTWEVAYLRGDPVPDGGQVAAAVLACEFAKALTSSRDCQLPQRIQNITRQGVTVTVMDDFKTLTEGGTGIWVIDSWVASVTKPRTPSSVLSPDLRRR